MRSLRDVFATVPSGVVAVAGRVAGRPVGIAASSFTSVSIEPALVSIAVARSSTTWPRLRTAPRIGISALAEHHDRLCRQLAGPTDQRFDAAAGWTDHRGALLLDDAVAGFTCVLHDELPAGDHVIALLRVEDHRADPEPEPLVFHRSGFRRLQSDPAGSTAVAGRINGEPVARPAV